MKLQKNAPIGVLDSGVGGLTVLRCLQELLPAEDFLYLGDTARTPYGVRPEAEIRQFMNEMLNFMEAHQVKMVVVACNTLTMLGVESLQEGRPFPIIGMSKGVELLLKATKNKKIGIMATPFTISTETHKKAIAEFDDNAEVFGVPCPDFVTLVEGCQFGTAALEKAAAEYSKSLHEAGVDVVLLACTHFPFVRKEIEVALGSAVKVIDPAESTSMIVKAYLSHFKLLRTDRVGKIQLCATADIERVRKLAERMHSVEDCEFQLINLQTKQ